jgi:hypothetical protein
MAYGQCAGLLRAVENPVTDERRRRRARRARRMRQRRYTVPIICGYCANCSAPMVGTRTQFYFHKPSEIRKYCSRECQTTHQFKGAKTRTDHTCRNCGQSYRPRRSTKGQGEKYCSRKCAFADIRSWMNNDAKRRTRDTPKKSIDRERRLYVKWSTEAIVSCLSCRRLYKKSTGVSRCCSKKCASHRQADLISRPRATRHCKECGVWYSAVFGYRNRDCCSDECEQARYRKLRREHKAIDKALRRSKEKHAPETIDPLLIFERDGWQCQYCGCEYPSGATRHQ